MDWISITQTFNDREEAQRCIDALGGELGGNVTRCSRVVPLSQDDACRFEARIDVVPEVVSYATGYMRGWSARAERCRINDDEWTEIDGNNVLMATPEISICGVPMHVMAYRMAKNENGQQRAMAQGDFEDLLGAFDINEPLLTAQIKGHEYVIFAHPHED